MPDHLSQSGLAAGASLCFGAVSLVLIGAAPSSASEGEPYRARFPIPKAMLTAEEFGDALSVPPLDDGVSYDDDAVVFEPNLTKAAIRTARSDAYARAGRAVPLKVIRNGLSARRGGVGTPAEREVGFKLGADLFSVTTRVIAPPGAEQGRDARIDWRLARPIANTGPGFLWTVSTEGGTGVAARPTQNANLLVGYRQQIMEHLTVTSQVAMGGSYVFAPDAAASSEIVPEVRMTANLGTFTKAPWDAALDVTLARRVPLDATPFETRASAMLRLKYALE